MILDPYRTGKSHIYAHDHEGATALAIWTQTNSSMKERCDAVYDTALAILMKSMVMMSESGVLEDLAQNENLKRRKLRSDAGHRCRRLRFMIAK
jgi:hypothetical protein